MQCIENEEKLLCETKACKNKDKVVISFENLDEIHSYVIQADENITVLGIPWDQVEDTLVLDFSQSALVTEKEIVTKRLIVSTVVRTCDPLGLITPVIIPLKWLF